MRPDRMGRLGHRLSQRIVTMKARPGIPLSPNVGSVFARGRLAEHPLTNRRKTRRRAAKAQTRHSKQGPWRPFNTASRHDDEGPLLCRFLDDLADDLLLSPAGDDLLRPLRADPGHFTQAGRFMLDDVEYRLAKGAHELLGTDGPDASDHTGAEILLDAFDRRT